MWKLIDSEQANENNTVDIPEMDEEDIVQAEIVYPIKKKDDGTSEPVFFVDDIYDTIDLSGNIIALDMQPPEITDSQVNIVEISTTQPSVDIPPPPVKDQLVKPQLPLVSQATHEEPAEIVAEKSSEQEKEKEQEEEKTNKEKPAEPEKTLVKQENNNDDLMTHLVTKGL